MGGSLVTKQNNNAFVQNIVILTTFLIYFSIFKFCRHGDQERSSLWNCPRFKFWNREELQDFTVTVGETSFGCHKLLLAACSGFFRALFRSGMKETKQNCATLDEISSETFQLILEAIYTGHGILTKDNVIDIWREANQLQMTFMVTECEMFVINTLSLENYIQYYQCGKLFCSKIVNEMVWNFILQHGDFFFKTSVFLELAFDNVLSLIKSQDLAVSTEDEVLKAILNWVEYTPESKFQNDVHCLNVENKNTLATSPTIKGIKEKDTNSGDLSDGNSTVLCLKDNTTDNSILKSFVVQCEGGVLSNKTVSCGETPAESDIRKKHLFELVLHTRICLASHRCLKMLLSHPLVSETKQFRDLIIKAILYQSQSGKGNGQWPTGATHRNKSEYENVALTINKDSELIAYSFSKHNWVKYKPKTPFNDKMTIQMVTVDNSLYCLCIMYDDDDYLRYGFPFVVYRLTDSNEWLVINRSLRFSSLRFCVVVVDGCIYVSQSENFWKLNPSSPNMVPLCDVSNGYEISHLTSYDENILAFIGVRVGETDVLSFNISQNTWTKRSSINGPDHGMISFKDDHTTYLLQLNGDLRKLVKPQSDVVDFELVAKLWDSDWPLHGAVIFLDELYLYGTKSERNNDDLLQLKSVAGLFKKITYFESPETRRIETLFIPFIVDKKLLVSIY